MGHIKSAIGSNRYEDPKNVHSELEQKLINAGIPVSRHHKFLQHPESFNTLYILKKHFDYKGANMESICGSGGPVGQANRILELSGIENVTTILETLAESGYKLTKEWKGLDLVPCILEDDIRAMKGIASFGLDKFLKTFKKVKNNLGVHNVDYNYSPALNILEFAGLEDKYLASFEALCKCGYINFSGSRLFNSISTIEQVANSDISKFLEVFYVLKKRFGYKDVQMEDIAGSGGPKGQVNKLLELSRLDGAVKVLEILAESGYKLAKEWEGLERIPYISKAELFIVNKMLRGNFCKKEYYGLIKKLERKLDYKGIEKDCNQLLYIADFFSEFSSETCEKAVEALAERAYNKGAPNHPLRIWQRQSLIKEDVAEMKKAAYEIWKKDLDRIGSENRCLYKENTEGFIKLFPSLKETEQKTIIKAVLGCKHYNKEVADWLDKNYPSMVKEAGLSL